MTTCNMVTVGRTTIAAFPAEGLYNIPVKIDTGADVSSIWASELEIDDNHVLHFALFCKGSPYYSGKRHSSKHYSMHVIRNSTGDIQIRYRVRLSIELAGRKIRGSFNLADRSRNVYPVLVGCKLLNKKFLVDVSMHAAASPMKSQLAPGLRREFEKDPHLFFEKYHSSNPRGDFTT